jgi:hypothetical protein
MLWQLRSRWAAGSTYSELDTMATKTKPKTLNRTSTAARTPIKAAKKTTVTKQMNKGAVGSSSKPVAKSAGRYQDGRRQAGGRPEWLPITESRESAGRGRFDSFARESEKLTVERR